MSQMTTAILALSQSCRIRVSGSPPAERDLSDTLLDAIVTERRLAFVDGHDTRMEADRPQRPRLAHQPSRQTIYISRSPSVLDLLP